MAASVRWILLLSATALAQTPDAMRVSIEKQRAAAAVQREAVRKQALAAGSLVGSPASPPPAAAQLDCVPVPEAVLAPILADAGKTQKLDTALLHAVVEQESGFRSCAVSEKGAKGLMQLMPATAAQLHVTDVFDPRENIEAGAKFLRQLLDKYAGNLALALGAYNAGAGSVDDAGGVPDIPETRDYVESILQKVKTKNSGP
jgi:soluble lytic murein transglycosylase-like protein